MPDAQEMVAVALLKSTLGLANIMFFFLVLGRYCCLVDNTTGKAFSVKRAVAWSTAIAELLLLALLSWPAFQDLFIVGLNDSGHVRHAAITDLNRTPVKDLVQPGSPREVLVQQFQELFSNRCFDVLTERGIIPNHVSGSLLASPDIGGSLLTVLQKRDAFAVATCF